MEFGSMTSMKKTPAAQLIEEQIRQLGPMTFSRFVELALYHPRHGYYNRGESPRGRSGDYFTSLQVGPLFPEILADAVCAMKNSLSTDQFALVEWGAGDGEFMSGVLTALGKRNQLKGIRTWVVETSRTARERLNRKLSRFPKCEVVASIDELEPVGGLEGCFFSNEFFDALPFHRLRWRAGQWQEILIDVQNDRLVECERPAPAELIPPTLSSAFELTEGQELEVRPAMKSWVETWGPLLARGYVLTVDYGCPRGELLAPHRAQGTARAYFEHQIQTDFYSQIGRQDLTAHVDFTALAQAGQSVGWDPVLFSSQGVFLSHVGAATLEAALAQADGPARARLAGAVQQLLRPDTMGEAFSVLLQAKEAPLPDVFRDIPNRSHRLI
jgi:SAM-dependent MidA family methyltransferase